MVATFHFLQQSYLIKKYTTAWSLQRELREGFMMRHRQASASSDALVKHKIKVNFPAPGWAFGLTS